MPFEIQGVPVALPTEPSTFQGVTYVALRELTEALGGTVDNLLTENRASATIGPWTAQVVAGTSEISVENDEHKIPVTLTAPPYSDGGQMYVPYDFFRDAFGYDVTFADRLMTICNPNVA
jgi:hypothetical protein